MNWLARFLPRRVELAAHHQARLDAWRALPAPVVPAPLQHSRFVVMDVETSGLNLAQDHLIAIGAVAVVNGKIDFQDSFEVVLQQPVSSSKSNILIHGISGEVQRDGQPPAAALLDFLAYLERAPLVAFHVTFDQTMLCRAIKRHLGFAFKHEWLDLAYVQPGLYPQQHFRALDEWLAHFHIQNYARHNALADAVCTAQLFMIAAQRARQKNIFDYQSLQHLETTQRWLQH